MDLRAVLSAVLAGIAAFVLVGVATTELAATWIEFSLFVGLPAGVVGGAVVAAGVYIGLADDAPAQRRRVAVAVAGFGVVFLAVLLAASLLFDVGVVAALGVGVLVGLAAAVVSYRGAANPRPVAD